MFLELTAKDGEKKVLINMNKITSINWNHVAEVTQLWVTPVDAYSVTETLEVIKAKMIGKGIL